ncbi:MAG: SAM-dependent methyltransferase [Lautropia sp.]|nr:SAM-dependent methyltransferase [Lautropia sp.]
MPEPDAAALAVSRQLAARLTEAIGQAGGWLSFERYMEMALYEPGLGYYSNPGRVFGAGGDFVTAPELTPLFGATLARQLARWLPAMAEAAPDQTPVILEVGAGSGVLAAQVLNALTLRGFSALRYQILELSAERRRQQRQTLINRAPGLLDRVEWLETLPDAFCGIVIGNEVLDAMPVRVFEWRQEADGEGSLPDRFTQPAPDSPGRVFEMGVRLGTDGFEWAPRPADPAFSERVQALRTAERPWPSGYRSEVCPAQSAWLATVAEAMTVGVILLMDYGFPSAEYYHPQRDRGTLMCHYRHRSHVDPFLWPGLSDITAHIDYSALARAAAEAGLQALGYVSQASFLLNAGLLDELSALPREPENFWFAQAQAVQMLLSEAEMGELFKVIAFARRLDADALDNTCFTAGNRLGGLMD